LPMWVDPVEVKKRDPQWETVIVLSVSGYIHSSYISPCYISGRIAIDKFEVLDRRLPDRPVAYSPIEKLNYGYQGGT